MISAAGIGTGLDISSIINQLMTLERRPLNALEDRKSGYQSQLSAVGQLKSALNTFESSMDDLKKLSRFEVYKATSSDEDVFTAETSISANPGSFSVQVNNLAVAHKAGSAAQADKDTTTFGNTGDKMQITIAGNTLEVDTGGKTLSEIRNAINSAAQADENVDVSASIVKESDSSYHLVLTSGDTGTQNTMSFAFVDSGGGAVADPLTMGTIVNAEDASVTIDGTFSITSQSNKIDDAIDGVTLNLKDDTSVDTHTLDISRDIDAVAKSVQSFVDAYNSLRGTTSSLRNGQLEGDSTVRNVESQIRNVLNTEPTGLSGSFSYLAQVGVSLQRDGTMSLDKSKLEDALNSDFEAVADLFADNDQGYVYRLAAQVDSLTEIDGFIDGRKQGIEGRIETIDARISDFEYRLVLIEERLRSQFTALDVLVGQLQSTGNFLSNQLG